ncbi:membrane protein US30 [Human betaherpesvirus 5]|nr:membrane protein US30 [Human betaherpesvirus 5]
MGNPRSPLDRRLRFRNVPFLPPQIAASSTTTARSLKAKTMEMRFTIAWMWFPSVLLILGLLTPPSNGCTVDVGRNMSIREQCRLRNGATFSKGDIEGNFSGPVVVELDYEDIDITGERQRLRFHLSGLGCPTKENIRKDNESDVNGGIRWALYIQTGDAKYGIRNQHLSIRLMYPGEKNTQQLLGSDFSCERHRRPSTPLGKNAEVPPATRTSSTYSVLSAFVVWIGSGLNIIWWTGIVLLAVDALGLGERWLRLALSHRDKHHASRTAALQCQRDMLLRQRRRARRLHAVSEGKLQEEKKRQSALVWNVEARPFPSTHQLIVLPPPVASAPPAVPSQPPEYSSVFPPV